MRKLITTGALALSLLATTAGVALAQSSPAKVTVVHGVPGLTVDVFVDGDLTLEDFEYGDVAGPLDLAPGEYDLAVSPANAGIDGAVLTADDVALTQGLDATVVAHLTESGEPTLSIFVNDTSSIDAGNGRITVRHTAQAPAVDIWADGSPLFVDLSNPDEQSADVPAAVYEVAIQANPSSTAGDPAVGPVDVDVPEGTSRIVYAVGELGDTFRLLIQDIAGLETAPGSVGAGSGDLAASNTFPLALIAAFAGLVLILAGGRVLAYRRSE